MPDTSSELRSQIVSSLKNLSADTERVYLNMAETYPALMKEMRRSLESAEHLLRGTSTHETQDDNALLLLIDETHKFIHTSNTTFSKAHKKDQEIYNILAEQLETVSHLREFINHIHDDSSAMELISLNAMTVALKAGAHGRAFSVITEELQRLSARTIDLTESVTRQGDVLIKQFSEFKEILQGLNAKEETMFGSFIERINACFEDFTQGVRYIIRTILELRKKSEKVLEPLIKIMTEIQNHDLIRQSIDHVIMSLQEIKPLAVNASLESSLDELAFLEILPDLCTDLLTSIADQILANKGSFETNLAQAQTIIDSIEAERDAFIRISLDSDDENSLARKFQNSHNAFENLFQDIESLYRSKALTVSQSRDVQYMVKQLDSSFKSFENLITRFRTIDIASRIEIAKQDVLFQMSGTVNEMTALTLRIEEDVAKSDTITAEFLDTSQRLLEQYRRDYLQTSIFSHHFIVRLRNRSEKLVVTKDRLVDSIINSKVFTQTFLGSFEKTLSDLDGLNGLLNNIKQQKKLLADIKSRLNSEKRRYMQENNIKEWKLENQKLRTMIDRFTIFTHKKIAGKLGGFEVEQGVQSGEITFF